MACMIAFSLIIHQMVHQGPQGHEVFFHLSSKHSSATIKLLDLDSDALCIWIPFESSRNAAPVLTWTVAGEVCFDEKFAARLDGVSQGSTSARGDWLVRDSKSNGGPDR